MGGSHSHDFDQKAFNSQWQRKQGDFNGRSFWRSKTQPQRQLQQYAIFATSQHDIQRQGKLFDLRRNSDQLVAATHLKQTVKGGLCSSAAHGRLFLQRIPLRLDALQDIPFPDILHLHFNSLSGYKKLAKAAGPFRVQQQQIGFNGNGQAKVWLNSDYSAARPMTRQVSQGSMVRNLLRIIQDNTDHSTTPRQQPSITNYIYRNSNQVSFDDALIAIRQYANTYNNGVIPKNLECIQKAGIQNISKSLVELKQENVGSTPSFSQANSYNAYNNNLMQNTYNNGQPPLNNVQYVDNRPLVATSTVTPVTSVGPVYTNIQPTNVVQQTNTVQPVQNSNLLSNRGSQVRSSNINFNFGGSRAQIPPQQPPVFNQPPVYVQQPLINPTIPTQQSPLVVQQPSLVVQQPPIVIQQQPIRQPVFVQNVQPFSPVPPQQGFIQSSQVQTVRPGQQFVGLRSPEQQRVIQQVIREPQGPQSVGPVLNNQGNAVQRNIQVPNIVPVIPLRSQGQIVGTPVNNLNNQVQSINLQNVNRQNLSNQNRITQQVVQVNTLSNQTQQNQFSAQSQNRNAVESKTSEFQSANSRGNPQKVWNGSNNYQTSAYGLSRNRDYGSVQTKTPVQQVNALSTNRYKDVDLEDGKSSEALLAQLRGFSSSTSRYDTSNFNTYTYDSSSNYKYESSNNYNFQTSKPQTTYSNQNANQYTSNTNQYSSNANTNGHYDGDNLYNTFQKYAKGGNNLQDNLQLKYSMTQQLYDHPSSNQHQYNQQAHYISHEQPTEQYRYQQEGQYHVDYDPEILADIEKMKR